MGKKHNESKVIVGRPTIVKVEHGARSIHDRRRKVDRHVVEYYSTDDGEPWRVGFETQPDVEPIIPASGTKETIYKQRLQWKA